MGMATFQPLVGNDRENLLKALQDNASEANRGIRVNRDTSFGGYVSDQEISDDEVVMAIKSVPVHY